MPSPVRRRSAPLVTVVTLLVLLVLPRSARAERDLIVPLEEGGRIVVDQLAGLRVNASSGVSYAGPLGVAMRTEEADAFAPGAPGDETKTTTLWLAPSADVFVTDHLSLGGLVEVAHTFGSTTSGGRETALPGTTTLSVVPRIGFYAPFGDRFGIWPRLGVGYTRAQAVTFAAGGGSAVRDTFQSMLLEADLSLVYRLDETFFLRAGPSLALTLGGRHETESAGVRAAADASVLQLSGTVGFGVSLDP